MYTEDDMRRAFRAGWQERNRNPGLKKYVPQTLDNALRSLMGGGRHNEVRYVPDDKQYHNSIWLRCKKTILG